MREFFDRLRKVESGLESHVASCTERRDREEERQTNSNHQFGVINSKVDRMESKISDVQSQVSEMKSKFAVIVSGLTSGITLIGWAILEYLKSRT